MPDSPTILLVDDDPGIIEAFQCVLESKGYRVLTAADGAAGLDLAASAAPDLVVADLMMPKMSGLLVLKYLKEQSDVPPRVVLMTATEGMHLRAYAAILGADDYLHKPFSVRALLDSVERLCPLDAEAATPEPVAVS